MLFRLHRDRICRDTLLTVLMLMTMVFPGDYKILGANRFPITGVFYSFGEADFT